MLEALDRKASICQEADGGRADDERADSGDIQNLQLFLKQPTMNSAQEEKA
jgi:hypothetical protein